MRTGHDWIEMSGKTVPTDGPVDPSLVGSWQMYVFLEQAWKVWELDIAADGTYAFYDDGLFGHSGTFEAQNGTWVARIPNQCLDRWRQL